MNEINIIVQNQVYLLERDLLLGESDNKQIKNSKDVLVQIIQFTLPMPEWVTKNVYLLVQKYLRNKDVLFLKGCINDNDTIVKLLRTADYLGLTKFHEKFINQVLIPNINCHNCLALLQESHKKLKNINDSQTWYNLLNMSIIYLSTHAYDMFKMNSIRFKNLNQKIVNQVLERVIRLQRKVKFQNQHILHQLIIQCKQGQVKQKGKLFEVFRNNLKNKKIHSKIHAKLSWKLQNVPQLVQKNTKNFKYLDMNWFLRATKTEQGLLVTLNLIPFQQVQSPQNLGGSEAETSHSYKASEQRSQAEQINRNDTFSNVGVFYSKVHWKFQQQIYNQDIKTHYILMNSSNSMEIILIDKKMQKIIGNQKVELTIFCNTQAIYSFMLNYVFWHFDTLFYNGRDFCREELLIMVKASKKLGNYLQALKLIAELLQAYPSEIRNEEVSQGFNFSKMNKIQLEFYRTVLGKKLAPEPTFTKIKNIQFQKSVQLQPNPPKSLQLQPQQIQVSSATLSQSKRRTSPITITPINSINRKVNFSNSSSQLSMSNQSQQSHLSSALATPMANSNFKDKANSFQRNSSGRENVGGIGVQSLNNSRGEARNNSKRKIFGKSGSFGKGEKKDMLLEQMMRVTDISSYLFEDTVQNPQYHKMLMILKA